MLQRFRSTKNNTITKQINLLIKINLCAMEQEIKIAEKKILS